MCLERATEGNLVLRHGRKRDGRRAYRGFDSNAVPAANAGRANARRGDKLTEKEKADKEVIDAAIERLKAELQRRTDERIANGDVVMLPPVIVGLPEAVEDEKARKIAQLRAKGEERAVAWGHSVGGEEPITAIITGVPRAGRDDYPGAIERLIAKPATFYDPGRVH